MGPLSSVQIRAITSRREQGLAYKKIAKLLKLSSSSVYKYAKPIELSEEKRSALKQNELHNQKRFASVFATEKEIKLPVLDSSFANLLGHLFFDGSVFRRARGGFILDYTNASKEAINSFLEKMQCCFGLENYTIKKRAGKKTPYSEVQINSKKAYFFLKKIAPTFSTSKGARVPDLIKFSNPEIKAAFLRAFWDDEGCVNNAGDLSGCSASKRMVDDLVLLHRDIGIESYQFVSASALKPLFVINMLRLIKNDSNPVQLE